jgi:hypothetical protein
VAIPQIPKPSKFFHSASFWLARSGGFTLYMLYIGGDGIGVGVVFWVGFGFWRRGLSPAAFAARKLNPVFQGAAQPLGHPQFGSVEQVSPKSLPSARRFA